MPAGEVDPALCAADFAGTPAVPPAGGAFTCKDAGDVITELVITSSTTNLIEAVKCADPEPGAAGLGERDFASS